MVYREVDRTPITLGLRIRRHTDTANRWTTNVCGGGGWR